LTADEGKMYGRDGIPAPSYMLGSNGQSNGCVCFSDYPTFIDAYLNGDVDRLIVVERFDGAPRPKSGPGWLARAIGKSFQAGRSRRYPRPNRRSRHGPQLSVTASRGNRPFGSEALLPGMHRHQH
jgi:hypothetical protein